MTDSDNSAQRSYMTIRQLREAVIDAVDAPEPGNPATDCANFTRAQLKAIARELNDGTDPGPGDGRRRDYRMWIAECLALNYDPDRIASYECPFRRDEVLTIVDELDVS